MSNILALPQESDTYPQIFNKDNFSFRCAYLRSNESRSYGDPGQDFIAVKTMPDVFMFALCDGVSQSFLGNIGARYLGLGLMQWLEACEDTFEKGRLQASLSTYLVNYSGKVSEEIANYALSPEMPDMVRTVLEKKRDMGSESTFVCGRIDFPNRAFNQGRALFAWMGDSRLRFWCRDRERSDELGTEFITKQRWSSRKGPVGGDPHVFADIIEEESGKMTIDRLLSYSDGIASMDKTDQPITNNALKRLIINNMTIPENDDISYLELWLDGVPSYLNTQDDDVKNNGEDMAQQG